jgi:NAD(P)-dependent dehydrogenase (short-subunit alcohol dehydrogenase family)
MNIGVNHIGHFLLTNLLLDLLKAAAPSRVITVASEIHHTSEMRKDEFERNKFFWSQWKQFAHSKLANVLFMRELAKKLEGSGVTSNGLCPGAINTEAIDKFNIFVRIIMYPIKKLFFKTPEVGAETPVMLAVEPQLEKVNGVFYKFCEPRATAASAQNDDGAERRRISQKANFKTF